jgi:hypothetical protein
MYEYDLRCVAGADTGRIFWTQKVKQKAENERIPRDWVAVGPGRGGILFIYLLLKLRGIYANANAMPPLMDGRQARQELDKFTRQATAGMRFRWPAWKFSFHLIHSHWLRDQVSSSINSELTTAWLPVVVVMNHYSIITTWHWHEMNHTDDMCNLQSQTPYYILLQLL